MIRAVVIDDEKASAAIIRHFIEEEEIPMEIVGEAEDGRKALDLIDETDPQIVFLDIQMPEMSGFDVMNARPNFRYVIITAYDSFDYAKKSLQLGARDLLLKPIEKEALKESITRAVGWKFTQNPLVNDIIEYINNNYNKKIEVNQLSKQFFTTPSHIARVFKAQMGMGCVAYIHQVRMQKAVDLLNNTAMSIKEISDACGYESINNFYKYFRQYTGKTPAEYRKQTVS